MEKIDTQFLISSIKNDIETYKKKIFINGEFLKFFKFLFKMTPALIFLHFTGLSIVWVFVIIILYMYLTRLGWVQNSNYKKVHEHLVDINIKNIKDIENNEFDFKQYI